MQAESKDRDARPIFRWRMYVIGRRLASVTWAATADEARRRCEARGLKVVRIEPAGGMLD